MYLAKQLTPRSLPEIGRKFGGRDHTTVIHAVRKIEELSAYDASFREDVELLLRLLRTAHFDEGKETSPATEPEIFDPIKRD